MDGDERSDRLQEFLAAPTRALWKMALPMIAGTTVHTMYIVADTAFIGTLGTHALAAATFVAPLFLVILALTMGLGTAVTALVARAVGRGDATGADATAGTALVSGVILGLVFGVLGLVFGPWMLSVLGAEEAVVGLGWEYLQVLCLFMPLFFVSTVLRSILTGEGDAKMPMLVLAVSTVSNIALDALFILELDLGLRGAALATTLSVVISVAAFSVLLLRRTSAFVRLQLSSLRPSVPVLRPLFGLAAPIAASMLVMSLGGSLYNRLLSEFGSVAIAAYGAASKVDMVVVLPIFGLSGAAVTVVGMFAGAGRDDLVRSTALYTYRWAMTLAVVIGGIALASSETILRIFTDDATTIEIGTTYLGFMIFVYPMVAVGMTTGRLLQGLGHGVPALIITTLRVLLIGVPVAYGMVHLAGWSIEGVWVGILTGAAVATLTSVLLIRRLMWQAESVTRTSPDREGSRAR